VFHLKGSTLQYCTQRVLNTPTFHAKSRPASALLIGSSNVKFEIREVDQIFGQIVSMREKTRGNTNLVASCHISCGHTTDFYLGKTDLPRANSSKISRGQFTSGFILPVKNSGKFTLLISAPKVFTHS